MTSRQLLLTVEGLTHASSVIPLDRCNDAASETVTSELVPLNCNALPYLPDEAQVAFASAPLFPFPDPSLTVDPDPSSNPYAATRPDAPAGVVALAVFEYGLGLPAASVARTR